MVTAGPKGSNGRSHGARDYPGAAASQYPGLGLLNKGIKDGMDVPQPAWLWPQEAPVFSGTQCPHLENRGQLTHSSAKVLLDWSGQGPQSSAGCGGPWSNHGYYCAGGGGCFRVFGPLGGLASPAWAVSSHTGMDTSSLNSCTHAGAAEREHT